MVLIALTEHARIKPPAPLARGGDGGVPSVVSYRKSKSIVHLKLIWEPLRTANGAVLFTSVHRARAFILRSDRGDTPPHLPGWWRGVQKRDLQIDTDLTRMRRHLFCGVWWFLLENANTPQEDGLAGGVKSVSIWRNVRQGVVVGGRGPKTTVLGVSVR